MASFVQMDVMGVALDGRSNTPIVLLRDKEKKRVFPIWIGIFEAQSIVIALEHIKFPRPLTHDLLKSVIEQMGGKIRKIVVNELQGNTYYAQINVEIHGSPVVIDSRPSDAIALALRTESPIFVAEHLISDRLVSEEEAKKILETPITEEDVKQFRNMLKDIKPEDFLQEP